MNEHKISVKMTADVSDLKKGVQEAQKEVKTFSQKVKDAMGDMPNTMKSIGDKIGSAMKTGMSVAVDAVKTGAKAMAAGLASVSAAVIGVVEGTEEYRDNMAKLSTAFEQAGSSAEQAKTTYNDLYRVMGDNGAATEAAQSLSQLTTDEKALAEWTKVCTGVYAELGTTLPIESLAEAANESAKVGQVTGALADAINWANLEGETFGVTLKEDTEANKEWNKAVTDAASAEDYFNLALQQCNSEAEREKLIRETLIGIYGESADAFEENNKKILEQRDAQAKLQETLAAIGDALTPVVTAFTQLAAEALALVQPYIEDLAAKIPGLVEQFKTWASDALPGVVAALAKVAEFLGKVISAIVNNWGKIVAIAGIIGGITAAYGLYNAVAAVKEAMDKMQVTTLWGLVSAYAAQAVAVMAALAPYIAIVAAIAAVIAIIVLCVKHWDKIKEAVGSFFKAAGEWLSELGESISEWWQSVTEGFSEWWDGIAEGFSEWWSNLVEGFSEFFSGIWESISTWWSDLVTGFSEWWTGLSEGFAEWWANLIAGFTQFFSDIWTGISEWWANLVQGFTDFFSNIWKGISEWWGNLKDGWNESWENTKEKVSEGVENVKTKFTEMKDKATETFNQFKENAKNKFEEIKSNISEKTENAKKAVSEKYNQMKETMGTVMEAAKTTVKGKLDNIKAAYEANGGGIKGIVAGYMEAVKGFWSTGLTFIDTLTGGKLSNIAETFKGKLNEAKNKVSEILGSIKNKFNEIMEGAKSIVSGAIEKIKGFFNFSWSLPKLKMPHFSISGSFSLNPPSVPRISVSWYQFGGVFDNPHLFPWAGGIGGLGENGAEAIVPLEKNTEWLDRIATMLTEKQGGGRPIVLQVDGKTFAQISVDSINNLTRQTGSLPLKLV